MFCLMHFETMAECSGHAIDSETKKSNNLNAVRGYPNRSYAEDTAKLIKNSCRKEVSERI